MIWVVIQWCLEIEISWQHFSMPYGPTCVLKTYVSSATYERQTVLLYCRDNFSEISYQ